MIKSASETETMKMTGCLPKCTIHHYNFHQTSVEDAKWRKDWISSFYLSTKTTTYLHSEENYSYDEQVDTQQIFCLDESELAHDNEDKNKRVDLILNSGPNRSNRRLPGPVPGLVCDVSGNKCPIMGKVVVAFY